MKKLVIMTILVSGISLMSTSCNPEIITPVDQGCNTDSTYTNPNDTTNTNPNDTTYVNGGGNNGYPSDSLGNDNGGFQNDSTNIGNDNGGFPNDSTGTGGN